MKKLLGTSPQLFFYLPGAKPSLAGLDNATQRGHFRLGLTTDRAVSVIIVSHAHISRRFWILFSSFWPWTAWDTSVWQKLPTGNKTLKCEPQRVSNFNWDVKGYLKRSNISFKEQLELKDDLPDSDNLTKKVNAKSLSSSIIWKMGKVINWAGDSLENLQFRDWLLKRIS